MILSILGFIGIVVIAVFLFVSFYPSFGGDVNKERQELYQNSKQFRDGKFVNEKDVPEDPSLSEILKISRKFFFEKVENGRPANPLDVKKIDSTG